VGGVKTAGRAVRGVLLVGRVGAEVEKGAVGAEHEAMAAGWKRIAKALAGRRPLDASMIAIW
jgi:hypothetical protein